MELDQFVDLSLADTIRSSHQSWGKLVSVNPNLKDVSLIKSIYTIGRGTGNDIPIDDIRLSNVHCILTKDENDVVTIEDVSSNGTYLDNEKIGKRNSRILLPGETIFLLHGSRVPENEVIGYIFSIVPTQINPLKRTREYEVPELTIQIKHLKSPNEYPGEEDAPVKCCQCQQEAMHIVTAMPCRHVFCASCYTGWMDKQQDCPKCTEEVLELFNKTPIIHSGKIFTVEHVRSEPELPTQEINNYYHKVSSNSVFVSSTSQREKKEADDTIIASRHDLETDVSSNENSKTQLSINVNTVTRNYDQKPDADKLAKYYLLFNKFTIE